MIKLVSGPVNPQEAIDAVQTHDAGGTAVFLGTVRNDSDGKPVIALEYDAYEEMAVKKIQDIVNTVRQNIAFEKAAIIHRTGRLELGETAVAIAVSAPHRAEAFAACQEIMTRIKKDAPIWKKDIFQNGEEWREDKTKKDTIHEDHE